MKIPPPPAPAVSSPTRRDPIGQTIAGRHRLNSRGGSSNNSTPLSPSRTTNDPSDGLSTDQIELQDLSAPTATAAETAAAEAQEKLDVKRAAKRRWLEEQDEMKFSHSIQFNAVPDWSNHYIAYSNLKKL